MTNNFSELTKDLSPERREKIEKRKEELRHSTKLRNALISSIVLFLMMASVSAVLAVLVHSIAFMPAWASFVLGSFGLLFLAMLGLEYSKENNND